MVGRFWDETQILVVLPVKARLLEVFTVEHGMTSRSAVVHRAKRSGFRNRIDFIAVTQAVVDVPIVDDQRHHGQKQREAASAYVDAGTA